jgi:dipeptidyl aminopeptidase/acylaminoacyl peptidase
MSGWWQRIAASVVLVVLACGLAPLQGRSQPSGTPRLVTIDDLMALSTINDVEIAPAGDRIAYTVSTPSLASNTHETRVFVVAAAGGDAMRLAEDAKVFVPALPAPRLRWSPDGTRVTFLGLGDGRPQVFAVAASGGPARALTHAPEGVSAYEWAPDGTRLAFLSRDGAAPPAVATPAGSQPPRTRLWVQSVDGAAPPQALSPPDRYVDSLSWSPDGREIAYASAPTSGFLAPYSTRIDAVTVASGATRAVVARQGMNVQPQFSPDGRYLAFVTTSGGTGIIAPRGLAITPVSGGDPAAIRAFPMNGAWMADVVWAADGQSLLVTMNEGTFATGAQMFEMPVVRVSLATGHAERVHTRPTVDYNLSLSHDGRTLAYRAVDARTMGELTVVDLPSGAHRTLTAVNPALNHLRLGRLEPVSWRSFDGMEIWGLLLTPPGYDGDRRLPLVVYCHGGPIGGVTLGLFPQFMHVPGQIDPYPTEAFASAGYAVLFPMPRGGSGYGEAGHRMIVNDWGGPDYKDIMAGVDHLIARGVADADRLGVMGASYGGYLTNWIVTQTTRFKAASAGASIADLTDLYYLTDGGDLMVEYFKRPWENPDGYRDRSPLTHAAKVTTPLLLQHGDRDPRVPLATAQKFHRALVALGKTVEFDVYPRGGHVFYEPVQERTVMTRNLEWFRRWISP